MAKTLLFKKLAEAAPKVTVKPEPAAKAPKPEKVEVPASAILTGATAALAKSFAKEYGKEIGSWGGRLVNTDRIPTGIFEFDLTTGGGFPRGRCSIIYGPESSCKTNLAYLAIAWHQRLWPDLVCSFVDIEHSFDPIFAAKFGVQIDKLYVAEPLLAEQAVNVVEALLSAEDCGLVVVDSLAALVTTGEFKSDAEKANVGGSSNPIGKMYRKTSLAMGSASAAGRSPTLIYINQTRFKIGVMFGDPETMPGGNAPRFQASLWVRVYGKNIVDPKVNQDLPVRKNVKMIIKKWKVPIYALNCEFDMAMISHNGFRVGESDSYDLVKTLLEQKGQFAKVAKGYDILGQSWETEKSFKEFWRTNTDFAMNIKTQLIQEAVLATLVEAEGDLGL
jgi:recombination protein RecA